MGSGSLSGGPHWKPHALALDPMPNVILQKPAQLPPGLVNLLGADFRPELRSSILYIPSSLAPQRIANVAFALSLALTVPVLLFVLWQSIAGTAAGTFIAALMLVLPAILTALSWGYRQKNERLEQQIASGEHRLGCWVTPTHIIWRDLEGLECVARKEIERVEVQQSGRPPHGLVIVHLHNGQHMRIVADWLVDYAGQVVALHALLTERVVLRPVLAEPLQALLRQAPDAGETRWHALMRRAEALRVAHNVGWQTVDCQNMRARLDKFLDDWPDREREAEPHWWLAFVRAGGADAADLDRTQLDGFKTQLDWRLPLARFARYDFVGEIACEQTEFRESFLHSLAFADLTLLDFTMPLPPAFIHDILTSQRFTHLKQLTVAAIDDPALAQQFEDWRRVHGIGEVAAAV